MFVNLIQENLSGDNKYLENYLKKQINNPIFKTSHKFNSRKMLNYSKIVSFSLKYLLYDFLNQIIYTVK